MERAIKNLETLAENKKDPIFNEFVAHFKMFIEKAKKSSNFNLNDSKDFQEALKTYFNQSHNKNREDNYATSIAYFSAEFFQKGNVDYDKFFENFTKNEFFMKENEREKQKNEEMQKLINKFYNKEINSQELDILAEHFFEKLKNFKKIGLENNLISDEKEYLNRIELKRMDFKNYSEEEKDKAIYQLDILHNYLVSEYIEKRNQKQSKSDKNEIINVKTNDIEEQNENMNSLIKNLEESHSDTAILHNLSKDIERIKALKSDTDFAPPISQEVSVDEKRIASVQAMFHFIRDKEQIEFPFKREDTLDNRFFKIDFFEELRKLPSQELKKLVNEVKLKNQALRAEIADMKEEKYKLMQELGASIGENSRLTDIKNIQKNNQQNLFIESNETKKLELVGANTENQAQISYKRKR